MAKTAKEAVAERIEIVDQPEEITEARGFNFKLLIPVVLIAALSAFFVVRRALNTREN